MGEGANKLKPGVQGQVSRGKGCKRVKNAGSGEKRKRGLIKIHGMWKKKGSQWKSKFCYFKLQWKSIGVKCVFQSWKGIHHLWQRKPFKSQRAAQKRQDVESTGFSGKHRAWKHKSRGKHGAWETRVLVGNTWRGKHEVWWKTRGLSAKKNMGSKWKKKNMGNHYFVEQNQNFVILNCIENHLTWNAILDHESELHISSQRKPSKCQRAVQWFSFAWDVYFNFHSNLRGFFFLWKKKNNEIIKFVLNVFNNEKAFLYK